MTNPIRIRFNFDKSSITASLDEASKNNRLQKDVKDLARKWMMSIDMVLKPEAIEESMPEFIRQSTLDYIDALEGILERLQSDTDTSDDLLEEIEKVLR